MPVWMQFILTFGGGGVLTKLFGLLQGRQRIEVQFQKDLLMEMGSLRQRCESLEKKNDDMERQVVDLRLARHAWRNIANVLKLQILNLMCDQNEMLTQQQKPARFDLKQEEAKLNAAIGDLLEAETKIAEGIQSQAHA